MPESHKDPYPNDPHADDEVRSAELEDEEGRTYRVDQQNNSPQVARGGGEFPDPHTPPQAPAPGSA